MGDIAAVIGDLERTLEIDLPDEGNARLSTGGAIVVEGEQPDGNHNVVIVDGSGDVYESSLCTPATDHDRYIRPFEEPARRDPPSNVEVIIHQTCHDFSFSHAGSVSSRKLEAARAILLGQTDD